MSERRTLQIEIRRTKASNVWCCHATQGDERQAEAIDCLPLVESLWAGYSAATLARFREVFPNEILLRSGLPQELIENHLLVDVYSARAFPALLTERIRDRMICLAGKLGPTVTHCIWLLHLPPTAGNHVELAKRIEYQLNHGAAQPRHAAPTGWLKSAMQSWLGLLVGCAVTIRGISRIHSSNRSASNAKHPPLSQNLFVLFNGLGNHTRHIWHWLQSNGSCSAAPTLLLLGHQCLDAGLQDKAQSIDMRVVPLVRFEDVLGAVRQLLCCWGKIQFLHATAEGDLGVQLGWHFNAQTAAWWLRGFLHERYIAAAHFERLESTVAVFGLIAHADSRMADLALRRRGVRTVHWLHGIVEDSLHYRANATVCLCLNPGDTELRIRHGNYQSCLNPVPSSAVVAEPNDEWREKQGLLLVTNLIHPDNRFIRAGAPEALADLLQMVAEYAKQKKISPLTWRPHPRESAGPGFAAFQSMAESLGFRVDNTTPMSDQVRQHCHVISTFSGSVGDVAAAGGVPLIYGGLPYEVEGHWGLLPSKLKFRTRSELESALALVANKAQANQWRQSLCQQYNKPAPQPADFGTLWERIRRIT